MSAATAFNSKDRSYVMRAGRGMWHGGGLDKAGRTRGFQLWIALPPALELGPTVSIYQAPEDVQEDGPARVLLGSCLQAYREIVDRRGAREGARRRSANGTRQSLRARGSSSDSCRRAERCKILRCCATLSVHLPASTGLNNRRTTCAFPPHMQACSTRCDITSL